MTRNIPSTAAIGLSRRLVPKPNFATRNRKRRRDARITRVARVLRAGEPDCIEVSALSRKRANRPDPRIWRQSIEEIDISKLHSAIRANLVSFPSQIPVFPGCGHTDVQHKLVQLYFLFGWTCATIGARYGLARDRVRRVLSAWKWRAANAGYIQRIPFAEFPTPTEPYDAVCAPDAGCRQAGKSRSDVLGPVSEFDPKRDFEHQLWLH